MAFKIWVGKRESDILTYNYFNVSITFWGSNTNNNHSFCTTERLKDNYANHFTKYVLHLLQEYITHNVNIEIHFYNNSFAYKLVKLEPTLEKYIVNLNCQRIFDIVRHKTLSRVWLQNTVIVPPFTFLSKIECHYCKLQDKFPGFKKFIIQKSISGGGTGTYLICENNWKEVINILDEDDVFLVSPFFENNISLSCHLIIDNKKVIVFPISEQLLRYEKHRLSYCGNKFLDPNSSLAINTKLFARTVGNRLMDINYKGICGLDFIYSNHQLMLIEINPRYQGSSYLINAELNKLNLPSLFELNNIAFASYINDSIAKKIDNMKISYESHNCVYNESSNKTTIDYPPNAIIYLDGLSNASKFEDGVYMYRYLK